MEVQLKIVIESERGGNDRAKKWARIRTLYCQSRVPPRVKITNDSSILDLKVEVLELIRRIG